jgi:hypothetical protein
VFLSKSLQAIENKRSERKKERQERKRVRKPLKTKARRGGQGGRKLESWGYTPGRGKGGYQEWTRQPNLRKITASVTVCQVGN